MKVPLSRLTASSERIRAQFVAAIDNLVAAGGPYVLSPDVAAFEEEWAAAAGSNYAVGVNSGADALFLSLLAAGVRAGDEVITQGNAYNATVAAILRAGAVPRFVDIRPDTLTLDESKLSAAVTKRTTAIVPVHLYGQMNDMKAIAALARNYGLAIVEDCAQAHGAAWDGRGAGTYSLAAAFSFYPTKNLGAFGDAGAVITDDARVAEQLRARRHLGQVKRDVHRYRGWNMRLDTIQAIALRLQLPHLEDDLAERRRLAQRYDQLLEQAGWPVQPVTRLPEGEHAYHLYVVRAPEGRREALRAALAERGVETGVHYPVPVYRQPFYRGAVPNCPVADAASEIVFSLPLFLGLAEREQAYVRDQLAACALKVTSQRVRA